MIPNGEGWHYLAVKGLLVLLREMTSKRLSDFYCQNCFHSFARGNKCESHKRVCKNKDFCNVLVLSKDTKILEFSQHQKYDKAPFITYADLACST